MSDTDPDTGTLSHRRRFVPVGGVPDGLTQDAAGGLWVALLGGRQAGDVR